MRRGLCCVLGMLMLLSGCGAGSFPKEERTTELTVLERAPEPEATVLTLPYARGDSLHPYFVTTELNRQLLPLMYEGLFVVNEKIEAVPVLAKTITQRTELLWEVRLASQRLFQDGSPVTAADVADSFEAARKHSSYQTRLANILTCTIEGDHLLFQLKKPNQLLAHLLTFPVIPAGSSAFRTEKTKADSKLPTQKQRRDTPPPGTGRYRVQKAQAGDSSRLVAVETPTGSGPGIREILLRGIQNTDALMYGLEMGQVHFACRSTATEEAPRISATLFRVRTMNLIFLGFQSGRAGLQDPKLRQALSACVDRAPILKEATGGAGVVSTTPFHPAWSGIRHEDFKAVPAGNSFQSLGYQTKDGVLVRYGKKLSLTLLVDQSKAAKVRAAKLLRQQVQRAGIELKLSALPKKDYQAAFRAGSFDLYLGEVQLTPDGSLEPFFTAGGNLSRGIQTNSLTAKAYADFRAGKQSSAEFASVFQEEVPFIPLGFRETTAAAARQLSRSGDCLIWDLYRDISDWRIK